MPEDSTTDTSQVSDQTTSTTSTTDNTTDGMTAIEPDFQIPSLDDIEYATPSAYIDPDLPTSPTPIEYPGESKEEEPKEEPKTIEMTPEQIAEAVKASNEIMGSVAEKIANSRNIIVALSSDPSIDELSAAISLALFLDRLGKHSIAIYSGTIPSALQFLKPDDAFEKSADVMQDFVIALNKEKADHLRYKLDGDYVKIFITPYKDRIVSEDLDFSYGNYNIDLAISLNVNNGVDLDPALREYGTIMQDASIINITTGNPGKFGEIEWSNKFASSVSEMVANLLLNADTKINTEEATALLAGIVAATNRFSRANTTSVTMQIASQLMDAGANQQLVAVNISEDLDNQFFTPSDFHTDKNSDLNSLADTTDDTSISFESTKKQEDEIPDDGTALQISHGDEPLEEPPEEPLEKSEDSALLGELKATEDSLLDAEVATESNDLSQDLATTVDEIKTITPGATIPDTTTPTTSEVIMSDPTTTPEGIVPDTTVAPEVAPEITNAPTEEFADATSKYSQMLTDALNESNTPTDTSNMATPLPPASSPTITPIASAPDFNATPEPNYNQTTGDILPPPPAPPIDINSPMPVPAPASLPPTVTTSESNSTPSVDPSAFAIPTV